MHTRTIALLAALTLLAGCAGDAEGTADTEAGAGTGADAGTETGTAPSQPGDPVSPADEDADDDGSAGSGADDGAASDGELTVEVDLEGTGSPTTWTLSCDPPAGDHPDPEAACAAIADAGGAGAFAPVPADQMCTQIYGGPQVATVSGTFDGAVIVAEFSRQNGCEIARWDALAPLLGEVAAPGTVTE